MRWSFAPGVDPAPVAPLLARAVEMAAAGTGNRKDGRRKELYELNVAGAERDYLLKVNRYRPGVSWTRRLLRSKSRRELRVASALAAAGLPCPVPVAAGELRRAGLLIACYLLIPRLRDHRDLTTLCRDPGVSAGQRREATVALGRLASQLHGAGFWQPDFAPNNFLVRDRPLAIVPIDFERAGLRSRLSAAQRGRMLAKLQRHTADARLTQRLRFAIAYAGDRDGARRCWRRVERETERLARSDLRRLRRRSIRDGRRYRPVRSGAWTGWGRRDGALQALAQGDCERADAATEARRVEGRDRLWLASYPAGEERAPIEIWALAQLLWIRRLSPRPVCLFARDGAIRLYLERERWTRSPSASEADSTTAATVLFRRLLAIGEIEQPLQPGALALRRRVDGSLQARLIDVGALHPQRTPSGGRSSRARELAGRLR